MVRRLEVTPVPIDKRDFLGKQASAADYDTVIEGEPTDVVVDGKVVAVYRPLPATLGAKFLGMVREMDFGGTTRVGAKSLYHKSQLFGYTPRSPLRRNWCSICALAREKPELYQRLVAWGKTAVELLEREAPEALAEYWGHVNAAGIAKSWLLPGTPFSTAQINESSAVAYHLDAADVPDTWNVLFIINSQMSGGLTVLPRFRLAFSASGFAFCGFPTVAEVHGVTPLVKRSPAAFRYAMIFYTMTAMGKCGSPEEELDRIRNWSTKSEAKIREQLAGNEAVAIAPGTARLRAGEDA